MFTCEFIQQVVTLRKPPRPPSPVLMTLCLRRMMSVYVPSVWNFSPNCSNTWLNFAKLPVLTAAHGTNTVTGSLINRWWFWFGFRSRLEPGLGVRQRKEELTLCQQEIRHQGSFQRRLSELKSVRNLSQQQLHHDQQLMDLKTDSFNVSAHQRHQRQPTCLCVYRPSAWSPRLCAAELSSERWSESCEPPSIPAEWP